MSSEQQKLTLVILAAGLGTRFGGDKQLTVISGLDCTIMELNILDAIKAGVTHVVFVISQKIKLEVETDILPRLPKNLDIKIAIQDIKNVPQSFKHLTIQRKKPWGTGHALLMAKPYVSGKAIVITADDYYGASAYQLLADALLNDNSSLTSNWSLIGYPILDTLSEEGGVNRGICQVNDQNHLKKVVEFLDIRIKNDKLTGLNGNKVRVNIPKNSLVSMTIWGFDMSLFEYLESGFLRFLSMHDSAVEKEYYLPDQIQNAIEKDQKKTLVLRTNESWLGMTYRSELISVTKKLNQIFKGSSKPCCQSNK
ncbi:hypothetical protein [Pseudoalteromonas denitrificans]|uniref:MobA-like NTP transferase domain-containing protein n=1 Tax=Pseudoalteromonas denitrificans DSM 6059 TaxID=1123010 RepID=A0A1I1L439_9GAMM|nr:hypothetical protein [Pseudoalteromonas denitrificans]SFC67725.1 hypothetical protein SAMN02745724_02241 [Pseudoalteromonas denitrificans DSM 6059]